MNSLCKYKLCTLAANRGSGSRKTDYVPAGEEAGSKLDWAQLPGVKIISEG